MIDLPGAFLNAEMDEVVHMVLHGKLAELMVKFAPQIYRKYVTLGARGEPMLYVTLQKALYGCLCSALLFYLKLVADLEGQGFHLNPYDPCVANKVVSGSQMTLTFQVDDIKISHQDSQQVDAIIEWFKSIYGVNVLVSQGSTHDYLGMMLSYLNNQVRIFMADYVKKVINGFLRISMRWHQPLLETTCFRFVATMSGSCWMSNEPNVSTVPWLNCCL